MYPWTLRGGLVNCVYKVDVGRHATYTLGVFDGTASDRGLAAREISSVGAECKDKRSLLVRERAGGRGERPAARRSAFASGKTKTHNCAQFSWANMLCTIVGKFFSILLTANYVIIDRPTLRWQLLAFLFTCGADTNKTSQIWRAF
jgi:hypothetical protein